MRTTRRRDVTWDEGLSSRNLGIGALANYAEVVCYWDCPLFDTREKGP